MIKYSNLDIFVIYSSNEGRNDLFEASLPGMDIEHQNPSGFLNAGGGICIYFDKYINIFYSTNYYVLLYPVCFLTHSLYWLRNEKCDEWFDTNDNYPYDVVIVYNNELLRIQNVDENNINLSFTLLEERKIKTRRNPYFKDIIINKNDWYNATQTALGEYFKVLLEVISYEPNDEKAKILLQYYDVWNKLPKRL